MWNTTFQQWRLIYMHRAQTALWSHHKKPLVTKQSFKTTYIWWESTITHRHDLSSSSSVLFAASEGKWGVMSVLVVVSQEEQQQRACVSSVSVLLLLKRCIHWGQNMHVHVCQGNVPKAEPRSLMPPHLSSCVQMQTFFPLLLAHKWLPPLHMCEPTRFFSDVGICSKMCLSLFSSTSFLPSLSCRQVCAYRATSFYALLVLVPPKYTGFYKKKKGVGGRSHGVFPPLQSVSSVGQGSCHLRQHGCGILGEERMNGACCCCSRRLLQCERLSLPQHACHPPPSLSAFSLLTLTTPFLAFFSHWWSAPALIVGFMIQRDCKVEWVPPKQSDRRKKKWRESQQLFKDGKEG